MGISDLARNIDRGINRRGIAAKRERGWLPRILPYTGYGSTTAVRILARAVMADPADTRLAVKIAQEAKRGWRQFFTTQVGYLPVTVTVNGKDYRTRTDDSGYIDLLVEGHGLTPGNHRVRITPVAG